MINYGFFYETVLCDWELPFERVKMFVDDIVKQLDSIKKRYPIVEGDILINLSKKTRDDRINMFEASLLLDIVGHDIETDIDKLVSKLIQVELLQNMFSDDSSIDIPTRLIFKKGLNISARELNAVFVDEGLLKEQPYISNGMLKYFLTPTQNGEEYFMNVGKRLFYKSSKFDELLSIYKNVIFSLAEGL